MSRHTLSAAADQHRPLLGTTHLTSAARGRSARQVSGSHKCLGAGIARITISLPLSKTRTTVSNSRAWVSNPSRNSRCGQS